MQAKPTEENTQRPRSRRWLLEVLAFLLFLTLLHLWQTRDAVKGPAPALAASLVTGGEFSLATPREKPILVYFWATWCPVCKLTSSSVDALAKQSPVITIAMQSGSEETVAAHLENNALTFPVVNDSQGLIAKAWGVRGVPTIYILDREGMIRFVSVGYATSPGLRVRLWLAEW